MTPVHDIGSRRELLIDDTLISECDAALQLRLHQPERRELAFRTDAPWEGNACCYLVTMAVDGGYRMYSKSAHFELGHAESKGERIQHGHPEFVTCLVSADGRDWERADIGLVPFDGQATNNIVRIGGPEGGLPAHGLTPFVDDGPAAGGRFKAVGAGHDLFLYHSADGWDWELLAEEPVQRNQGHTMFDSQNLVFWDAVRQEYRLYFRDLRSTAAGAFRDIRTAASPDLRQWSTPEWLSYPDADDEELYTNQVQPYPRAPHIYVGFPTRYVPRPWSPAVAALPECEHRQLRAAVNERFGTALSDGLFMSSRDGVCFKRWQEAFIRPGPQLAGNWTYGDNFQGYGLIEVAADLEGAPAELSFFATEHYWRGSHTGFRRFALRLDGFVSMQAPRRGGSFRTAPIQVTGNALEVNVSTSAAGSMRIELQATDGTALPGFALDDCHPVIGDDVARRVSWRGGDVPDTRPLRLHIELSDADLYAFRFHQA
jgi:hypothetical protein